MNERFGGLAQQAGGLSLAVAVDDAVGRIGGVAIDPGKLERSRVHPRAVMGFIDQDNWIARRHFVEEGLGLLSGREDRGHPIATGYPRARLGCFHAPLDRPRDGVGLGARRKTASILLHAGKQHVDVGVVEARQYGGAVQIDPLGFGAGARGDFLVGANRDDDAVLQRHRLRPPRGGADFAAAENDVRRIAPGILGQERPGHHQKRRGHANPPVHHLHPPRSGASVSSGRSP
jgi:hypothetical protein